MSEPDLDPAFFDQIETALTRSARGRAFLLEHGRRSRASDTRTLLDALARLEQRVGAGPAPGDLDRLRDNLADMTDVIRRTRTDIADLRSQDGGGTRLTQAAEALDAIVATTERATSDILDSTEKVQETAWNMREGGFDPDLCDALEAHATAIYTACTFQDLTAQRISRVVRSLSVLEERLVEMNRIWGPAPGRAVPGLPLDEGQLLLSNDDIDFVLVEARDRGPELPLVDAPDEDRPARESPRAPAARQEVAVAPPDERQAAVLAELDRLSALPTRDLLRLLT